MNHQPPPVDPELRRRATERLRARQLEPAVPGSPQETARLVCELQIHQIELEMQNEELQQAQEQLRASHAETLKLQELSERSRRVLLSAAEDQRDSLREKDSMLKEIHHRVKNNLQIISSLLRMQADQIDSPVVRDALQDMQSRVRSMALIHEHLYRSDNLAAVNLAHYIQQLCQQLLRTLVTTPDSIHLHFNLTPCSLAIDQAIPLGLIVNELVSNAFKHAFPNGRHGEVRVDLLPLASGPGWRLRVADNGVGLPPDFDPARLTSLGMKLCLDLTRQLGTRLEIGAGPGAQFAMEYRPCANGSNE